MAPFPERTVGKELRAGGLLVRFLEEDTCMKLNPAFPLIDTILNAAYMWWANALLPAIMIS